MKAFAFDSRRLLMGRLERGDDLVEALTRFCAQHGVQAGCLSGLGALEQAELGYYDQAEGRYRTRALRGGLEIASLLGNVSLKRGAPFVHAHLVLADGQQACFGGHAMPGCRVFACEFAVWAVEGEVLERRPDAATGLDLW
ncbi:MAG: DNA-binding protein [Deltaproteobacteria bacterium]|nr:DNA-binding protein [Deltaproteobacteria bacterium]